MRKPYVLKNPVCDNVCCTFFLYADQTVIEAVKQVEGVWKVYSMDNDPCALIHVDPRYEAEEVWFAVMEVCDAFVPLDSVWENW